MLINKNIKIFILLILFGINNINAQYYDYFKNNYLNSKYVFEIKNNTELNSNVVNNEFSNFFIKGGFIDDSYKNRVLNNLNVFNNRVGGEINSGFKFNNNNDSLNKLSCFFEFNSIDHADMRFSKDFYNLVFFGNKMFEGKTADISNTEFNLINFDLFKFGVSSKYKSEYSTHNFSISLGFVLGRKNVNVDLKKGLLFTQNLGENIDFTTNYNLNISDTSKNKSYYSGFGSCVSFSYSIETKNHNMFSFSVENAGSVRWNNKSYYYTRTDTTFHYQGYNVPNIIKINKNIFDNSNVDSIANKYVLKNKLKKYSTALPTVANINYLYNFYDKINLLFGFKYIFNANYVPLFYLKTMFNIKNRNVASFILSYGGYGNFDLIKNYEPNLGLEYAHDFNKGFIFIIGTNYFSGFVYQRTTSGEGLYISLRKRI